MPNLATWMQEKDEKWFQPFLAKHPDVRVYNARKNAVSMEQIHGLLLTGGSDISPEFLRQEVLARGGLPLDVKIRYIAQVKVDPPTFVLFSNKVRKLHFSFERFMENRIRERFPFPGTPIIIKQRAKRVAHQTGD